MPVIVASASSRSATLSVSSGRADIEIGVLNNLSDAGLKRGEQQWIELIERTAGVRMVRLHFFTLPQIERSARTRARLEGFYGNANELKRSGIDGLIVTGCEPRAADLRDEDYWDALTDIVDWARVHTRSTIWSCLAAHAAVLHLDGVVRRRLPHKRSGIFPVNCVGVHALTEMIADQAFVPHSRHNDLDEGELVDNGYTILTRSPAAGVDTFVKSFGSLFLFLQGHPEYDLDALGREYRRDVLRFIEGVTTDCPIRPENYFTSEAEVASDAFAQHVVAGRRPPEKSLEVRPWQNGLASILIGSWLNQLSEAAFCAA